MKNRAYWLLLLLAAIYGPVLLGRYAVSDDYTVLWQATREWHRWPDLFARYWSDGRPLQFLNLFLLRWAGQIDHVAWARLPAVLGVICLGWRLQRAALRAGWGDAAAFALALGIACTPALIVNVNWVVCSSVLVACLLAELVIAATWTALERPGWTAAAWLSAAVLLNLCAFCCNQPAGCFLWVWAFLLLAPRTESVRAVVRPLGAVLTVFLLSAALAYAVARTAPTMSVRGTLTADPLGKLHWFVAHPLRDALALGAAMPRWVGYTVLVVLAGSGATAALRHRRSWRLAPVAVLAACLPLTFLPNLVVAESWTCYRNAISLAPCVLILVWCVFERTAGATWPSQGGAAIRVAVAGITAVVAFHQVVWGYVVPQTRELRFLAAELARVHPGGVPDTVEIRLAARTDALGAAARYDEFGCPSSVNAWAAEPMLRLLLAERHEAGPSQFVFLSPESPASEHTLDMRRLRALPPP